jgi:uncharacterized membrane protein YdfJ with MMPL/SSD domain
MKGTTHMTALTRWVLAHNRIVVAFWLIVTLVGMASASSATNALSQKFSLPGMDRMSAQARRCRAPPEDALFSQELEQATPQLAGERRA